MNRLATFGALALLAAPALAQLPPEKALASMKAGEGLQVELFAAEPMLLNPTAIDVDHKGRVWVCEGVNYRCKLRNRPLYRAEGDRIEILIDEKGDGKATKSVTFYQGLKLMAPLGVCVIPQPDGKGLRVLVAQSPDILEFWDRDGDLKADGPPTKFLTGFGGIDHDHGVHGLSIGPDGKLYFTVGDQGVKGLQSKDGKGKSWTTNKTDCQAGTVWRCDLDGTKLELIAHNFRNNYECAVDSFGEIWLSDNDDDGNQQTRICHVMPGGNYGYWPRGPGQSHWHEEQPGIVHKTLRTGFGSPTGLCFYEGTLLPKQYQGDLIHCDAGPREVRYFKRIPKGAGYELEKKVMLDSTDTWFRPSAVRVAPDGSVFVADWYDPGVGGHGMGDWTRGRIYRLMPTGHKGYKVPEILLDSAKGVYQALSSPNLATRTQIFGNLKLPKMNVFYTGYWPELFVEIDMLQENRSDIIDGRMMWYAHTLISRVSGFQDANPAGSLNASRQRIYGKKPNVLGSALYQAIRVSFMNNTPEFRDNSIRNATPAHRREIIIGMRDRTLPDTVSSFYALAKHYDGSDHFYLSALNIACGTDPVRRDAILADFEKHFPVWDDKVADLVWELRPKSMLPKMGRLLDDPKLTAKQKARIVDIIAASDEPSVGKTVLGLLGADYPAEVKSRVVENLKLFLPTKWNGLAKSAELKTAYVTLLGKDAPAEALVGLKLAAVANDPSAVVAIYTAWSRTQDPAVRAEAALTLGKIHDPKSVDKLSQMLVGSSSGKFDSTPSIRALGEQLTGRVDSPAAKKAMEILQSFVTESATVDPAILPYNVVALEALAASRTGTGWLLKLKQDGKFPEKLVAEAGKLLRNSPFQGERNRALQLFPVAAKMDLAKLPSLGDLAKKTGDAKAGEKLFVASFKNDMQCMKCHKVNGQGGEIGPDLSAIGVKGSKENLFESILYPSRAIADQHVSWIVASADGQTITGLLVKETETALTIRDANGKDTVIETKNVESKKKSLVSLMPEDMVKTLTEDELVDLVAYMATLKAELKK